MSRLTLFLDFSVQPYSIGDMLVVLVGGLAAADEQGLDGLNVVALADPSRPHEDPNMAAAHRNPWESLGRVLPLFELAGVASVEFRTDGRAFLPPSAQKYAAYEALQRIALFHRRRGRVPGLRFSHERCAWADMVLGKCGKRVITVNLRQNYDHHEHRNHTPSVWAEAMERAHARWGVKFCVVGDAHEAKWLPHGFVIRAKDRHTSLMDDLALVHRSKAHIGSPSGPAMVATLGTAPYFIPQADMLPHLDKYGGALRVDSDGDMVYSFASPGQKWSSKPESVDLLVNAIGDLVKRAWPE